jgi:hypothetical protein
MIHQGSQVNTVADTDRPYGGDDLLSQCLSLEFQQAGLEFIFSAANLGVKALKLMW